MAPRNPILAIALVCALSASVAVAPASPAELYTHAECTGAAISVMPHLTYAANSSLNVACVGVDGQGGSDLKNIASIPGVNIVAVCDVDEISECALLCALRLRLHDDRKLFSVHPLPAPTPHGWRSAGLSLGAKSIHDSCAVRRRHESRKGVFPRPDFPRYSKS